MRKRDKTYLNSLIDINNKNVNIYSQILLDSHSSYVCSHNKLVGCLMETTDNVIKRLEAGSSQCMESKSSLCALESKIEKGELSSKEEINSLLPEFDSIVEMVNEGDELLSHLHTYKDVLSLIPKNKYQTLPHTNFNSEIEKYYDYYKRHKPQNSSFSKSRKSVNVKYFREGNKKVSKSFSFKYVKSLKDFRNLLGQVKTFLKDKKIKK